MNIHFSTAHLPDLINAGFEFSGGWMLMLNVAKLWKEKKVRGVHWLPTLFFLVWGWWNLYYYPSLGQWLSFAGGCWIAVVNGIWLALMVRYWRR